MKNKGPKPYIQKFHVHFMGDMSAGFWPYTDEFTIKVEAGIDKEYQNEFDEFVKETFKEWYDGAGIITDKEQKEIVKAEKKWERKYHKSKGD